MNVSFFQELLTAISERGRSILDRSIGGQGKSIEELCGALISGRGEASGVALADQVLLKYQNLEDEERTAFFNFLGQSLAPDPGKIEEAASAYLSNPGPDKIKALAKATESPRQELFRRLNLAPGATAQIITMREDLYQAAKKAHELDVVDGDIAHLLASWFNRGFLVLRRIDWDAPASILEKIIEYEAVHEIKGWEDLRRRLDPADRRCYGFFHPSLIDDPLIFVEVALTGTIPGSIQQLLTEKPIDSEAEGPPTTAVFYSISNCQKGLKGISFGSFLIKQVVEDLAREIPSLKTFVTLSPIPGFRSWIDRKMTGGQNGEILSEEKKILARLGVSGWYADEELEAEAKDILLPLAAHYFMNAKGAGAKPVDQVARFHLGNGAKLERINWLGDVSQKGMEQSYGLMVNYLYELKMIERNHEAYENDGTIAASKQVQTLLRTAGITKRMMADTGQP